MKQVNNSEALLFRKKNWFLGLHKLCRHSRNWNKDWFYSASLVYEITILLNWIHSYVNTLWIWVWNVKSSLPWNHFVKRLQFVKPTCHKIYQWSYWSIATTIGQSLTQQFCSFELYLQILAHLTGWWKTQNIGKLQQINFVLFEIYVWKLIIRIQNWFFYISLKYEWNNWHVHLRIKITILRLHWLMQGFN